MTDVAWMASLLNAARPQAMAALLRYFRDLDTAEEAFQDASLRALKAWPRNGPPRDPAAWLIMVGRNAGVDTIRKTSRQEALPPDELISDLDDAESAVAERLDASDYRDDILRLLFICCHPDLSPTQQIALALRIVSGLSVRQIARAFLVGESAMEQRITRAKTRVAKAEVPFEAPGAVERSERLAAVAAMIYLIFNEGYSAGGASESERGALCDEAIRLARLLLQAVSGRAGDHGAALDDPAAAFACRGAVRPRWRDHFAGGPGPEPVEPQADQRGSRPDRQGRAPLPARSLSGAGGDRGAACAGGDLEETDWAQIELLYATLERLQPSPVITLNRAVAVSKVRGPEAALEMIAPLAERLRAISISSASRARCCSSSAG